MKSWILVVLVLLVAMLTSGSVVADGRLNTKIHGRVAWSVPGGREADFIAYEFKPGRVYWQLSVG